MKVFHFNAAINIRAYGEITVAAKNLEAAMNLIAKDGFNMKAHFEPHGSGDYDFDWNHPMPQIWLNAYRVNDSDDETALCRNLVTDSEIEFAENSGTTCVIVNHSVFGNPRKAYYVAIAASFCGEMYMLHTSPEPNMFGGICGHVTYARKRDAIAAAKRFAKANNLPYGGRYYGLTNMPLKARS